MQQGIVAGPDGNLWFTEPGAGKIGQINPTTHAIKEFPIPTPTGGLTRSRRAPTATSGSPRTSQQDRADQPDDQAVAEIPIHTAGSIPWGSQPVPMAILVHRIQHQQDRRDQPNYPGSSTSSPPSARERSLDITVGPDGNLWFTESKRNNIGRLDPATGRSTSSPFPRPTFPNPGGDITLGPDGNLWFTEPHTSGIGRIDPTNGVVTNFPIPTASSDPTGIMAGPDGNLWFIEQAGNNVGQIDPTTGAVSETAILTPGVTLKRSPRAPTAISGSPSRDISTATYRITRDFQTSARS